MDIFLDTDINVIKQYVYADSSSLNMLKKMLDYRNLRTEQAYYSELSYRYDHYEFGQKQPKEVTNAGELQRSFWKDRLIDLDRQRRSKHNEALAAFKTFLDIGERHNLDYIYVGPTLSLTEAEKYQRPEDRAIVTDAMFQILYSIEESAMERINNPEDLEKNIKDYIEFKKAMESFNREYGVKKSLLSDEDRRDKGGIEFYDMKNNNVE